MFSTVVILAAVVAVALAQHGYDDGHGYSSQSIVLHQISHPQEKHEIYEPSPLQQDHHYTPIVQHIAPAVHHAPIVQQVAPVVQNVAPVVQHVAPVAQHIAPVVHQSLPVLHHVESHNDHHEEQHYAPAKYEFAYEVVDKHTGDIKSQHEIRDGYHVKGEYSLHQPDGRIRTVKYDADKHTGFNADVHYSGHAVHIEPQQHHH